MNLQASSKHLGPVVPPTSWLSPILLDQNWHHQQLVSVAKPWSENSTCCKEVTQVLQTNTLQEFQKWSEIKKFLCDVTKAISETIFWVTSRSKPARDIFCPKILNWLLCLWCLAPCSCKQHCWPTTNEPGLVNTQVHQIIHRYWPVSGSNRKYSDYSAKELEIGYFLYYPQ